MRTSQSVRLVVAVAAVALVGAAATSASAKKPTPPPPPPPPPTCNLLVDVVGDVSPYSGEVDILSGDVASGRSTVAGELRVKGPIGGSDPLTATGARWDLGFTVNSTRYTYELRRNALGAYMATFSRSTPGGAVVVAVPSYRITFSSITWTVPRAAVTDLPPTPSGGLLTNLGAETYAGAAELAGDRAVSKAAYQDGTPSCLKAA